MTVDINLDQDRRVALLVVHGDLGPATAPAVSGAIAGLVSQDGYDVVVDLSDTGTILAGGVRALRRGMDMAHQYHREVRVACPRGSAVRPALTLAHLDEHLSVYDTRAEALNALAGARV
jgi:anti-anti-sigma regulatory factor